MSSKKDIYYQSRDNKTKIHAIVWFPDSKPKAVIQIAHGLTEYAERYDSVARFFNEQGFLVACADTLGHGQSVRSEEYRGYFGKYEYVIEDFNNLRKSVQKKYPDLPYIFWGHSMGSFFGRRYVQVYGEGLAACIFTGPGYIPNAGISNLVCDAIAWTRGGLYYSKFIDTTDMDHYNDRIPDAETYNDWLSRNKEAVAEYNADPLCQKTVIKINGYQQLGRCSYHEQMPKNIRKMPKDLPVYILCGSEDAVSKYGSAATIIAESMKKEGLTDVTLKIYEGLRHQLHQEPEKDMFFDDILSWINDRI